MAKKWKITDLTRNTKAKNITVRVPITQIEAMDLLIQKGLYMSKNDIIRAAIREFLEKRGLLPIDGGG